jgi:hypothetical protein
MGAFFYVVAIMGCGDGGDCREARMLPARYATAAECRAALPAALARNTDVPFPEIGADCRPIGMRMAQSANRPRG